MFEFGVYPTDISGFDANKNYKKFIYLLLTYKRYMNNLSHKNVIKHVETDHKDKYKIHRSNGDVVLGITYEGMEIGDNIEIEIGDSSKYNTQVQTLNSIQPLLENDDPLLVCYIPYHDVTIRCKSPPTFYAVNMKNMQQNTSICLNTYCFMQNDNLLTYSGSDGIGWLGMFFDFSSKNEFYPFVRQCKYLKNIYKNSKRKKNFYSKFINFY